MINGVLLVNKPSKLSSGKVVGIVKKILNTKVGHLGTLDPLASGLLVLLLGCATKLAPFFNDDKKTYIAEITFNILTDTLDNEGEIRAKENGKAISYLDINRNFESFIGEYLQTPPKYSAKNVNGVRAYKLALSGEDFTINPSIQSVYSYKIIKYNFPKLLFEITVSRGFYVRSFALDFAQRLNYIATLTSLVRVSSSDFNLDESYTLEKIREGDYKTVSLTSATGIKQLEIEDALEIKKIKNGNNIECRFPNGRYIATSQSEYLALVEINNNVLKVVRGLWNS